MAIRNLILIGIAIILALITVLLSVFKYSTEKRLRKRIRGICIAVCSILIFTVILMPDLSGVKTTGPFSFNSVVLQLNDEARPETYTDDGSCRKLSVAVYYPTEKSIAPNSCPLIVFSHGAISTKTSNISLFRELASYGYVVVSIDHTYQAVSAVIDGKRIYIDPGYVKEINTENSHKDLINSYNCFKKWMKIRTEDINFIIDIFISNAQKSDNAFYSLIDPDEIGLAGHSLGGAAALGAARQREDIKAVIALESPYLYDTTGVDGDAFTWNTTPYSCAVMNIYSDSGYSLIETDNKYVQNKNNLIQSENSEYVYIEGSNHFTLTDLVRKSPVLCALLGGGYQKSGYDTLKLLNEKCLTFFDKHLV